MEAQQVYPMVFCRAQKRNINPETAFVYPSEHFTTMWIKMPQEFQDTYVPDWNTGSVERDAWSIQAVQWVGEEFNWTFLPMRFRVCNNENEVEQLWDNPGTLT
tara:strand:+ start:375 stop:683 length:309 start_codon:yes stop_codon:yes gene_type:complete